MKLVEAKPDGSVEEIDGLKDSHPSPVFEITRCVVSNPRPNADGSMIIGDQSVQGSVTAAICDVTPAERGGISTVYLYVNGYEEFIPLSTEVAKGTHLTSWFQPYPFLGRFETNLAGVPLDSGTNLIRFVANDEVLGITGYAEFTCALKARDLAGSTNATLEDLRYPAVRATLAFDANVHSLAELTATNRVTLTVILYNSALTLSNYSGTLYKSADEPLLLTNASASVTVLTPGALDTGLGGAGAEIQALITVYGFAPGNLWFRLRETGPDTSAFSNDSFALGLALGAPLQSTNVAPSPSSSSAWAMPGSPTPARKPTPTRSSSSAPIHR